MRRALSVINVSASDSPQHWLSRPACLRPGAEQDPASMPANGPKSNGSVRSKPPRSSKAATPVVAPSANGHVVKAPRGTPAPPRSGGVLSTLFGLGARLLTWYAIITILFRCPETLDRCTEASPAVCVPYFQLKHIVVPHVEPYYNTYAAPYVKTARPYYDAVDRAVLTPARGYAVKYGAPAAAKAQALGHAQWQKTVQPQLLKYQALARAKYDASLAPHVDRASAAAGPYYDIARTSALQTYHEVILPTYDFVQPYALQGYAAASHFAINTAVPSAVWAWNKTYIFLDSSVWPQVRVIYTDTVEPQLVRIGKRLGRYNNTGAQKASSEPFSKTISSKAASSFTRPTASTTPTSAAYSAPPVVSSASSAIRSAASAISSSIASAVKPAATPLPKFSDNTLEQIEAPEADDDEEEKRRIARETVAEDLKRWQEKYTKAADEGAAEIQERVNEIATQMADHEIHGTGQALVTKLQASLVSELVTLRRRIIEVVGSVQKGSATPVAGEEQIVSAVRASGLQIKERAGAVRTWHENFDDEVRTQVTAAADSHFEILGSIRDLALQKIGMKWAWMDGITYKDWAKYHLLKTRFDEWAQDLEKLVVSHPGLIECQNEAQAIEDRAMELASNAARELGRLKQVALLKLSILDDSNEFDSAKTQAAYEAAQKLKSQPAPVSEAEEDTREQSKPADAADTQVPEPAEKALEGAASASAAGSAASEQVSSVAAPVSAESVVSSLSSAFSSASESASERVSSLVDGTPSPSSAGASSGSISSSTRPLASAKIVADAPVIVANASETTSPDLGDANKPAPVPVPQSSDDSMAQLPEDDQDDEEVELDQAPPAQTASAVKPAIFGAAAQAVPSRKPIIDDDTVESIKQAGVDVPAKISSVASSAYSVAMSRASVQYDSALSLISANMQGTPLPMHSSLLSSVSAAYSKAVASASSRLGDAVHSAESIYGAASTKVAPTPTPTPYVDWAAIETIAASRLSQGRAWAEEQYESAKVAIGVATPTPTSPVDRLLQNAQFNYYAGLGVAHARYSEFLAAASSAYSSLTASPTPTDVAGTVSSVASVASESAASAASVVGENVAAAAAAGFDNASSVADAAGSAVSANWEAVVSQLSARVYGAPTPTPWYESVYSAVGEYAAAATGAVGGSASSATDAAGSAAATASAEAAKQYAVVSSIVSELLVGKEQSFSESVFSRLGAAYAEATATAKSAGDKAASVASEATEAAKSAADRVRDEL
ncbi:hypothetical protein RB601_002075 [Gaeumannomyces tritici]